MDHEDSEQTRDIFTFLTSQIPTSDVSELTTAPDSEIENWWAKIHLLGDAFEMVHQKKIFEERVYAEAVITPEMEAFTDKFEEEIRKIGKSIDGLTDVDIMWFLVFYDIAMQAEDADMGFDSKMKLRKRDRRFPNAMYSEMYEAHTVASGLWDMDLNYMCLSDPLIAKWNALGVEWGQPEIADALYFMPGLNMSDTAVRVIDAIDDALDVGIERVGELVDISPEGIASFIHHDIIKNAHLVGYFEPVDSIIFADEEEEEKVPFVSYSLDRRLVPVTSLRLLADVAERTGADEFFGFMSNVQNVIMKNKRDSRIANIDEWLLTLVLLSDRSGLGIKESMKGLLDSGNFPHNAFRDVFLDRQPGKIWLTNDGRIRISNRDLANATSIYESNFVAPEAPVIPQRDIAKRTTPVQTVYEKKPAGNEEDRLPKKRTHRGSSVQATSDEVTGPENAGQRKDRQRPTITLSASDTWESVGDKISGVDLEVVKRTIAENQEDGRHPISLMRAKGPMGVRYAKMRVNGVNNGIRVVLESVGENVFKVMSINYRSKAYRDL